jgi:TonB-linked SusC/RagA family outer membrane protein
MTLLALLPTTGLATITHAAHLSDATAEADITVTGRVTDETGGGVPGVTVVLKGTTRGASTDDQGNFSLSVPDGTGTLVVSSIGFVSQEVPINNQTSIKVSLRSDTKALEEVVVVGYGTQRREDVTGAISSVSSKEIERSVATTIDQALQGRVAGVVVNQNTAQPGGGVSVRIRGIGTLNGDQEPLYVIDGVIIPPQQRDSRSQGFAMRGEVGSGTNPLSSLNPNEIESIDILKDASATAIYGSQAANGVVIVTTKRGKSGAPKLAVETYYGAQQLPKKLDVMDLQQFATYSNEKASILGYVQYPALVNPQYLGKGTNWQNELFRTVPMYNATVRLSGGDERTQYLLSGSYFSQDGIALGSSFKRASARLNLDNKTTKWLKIGTSLQFSNINENLNSTNYELIKSAISITPDIAGRNPDGTYGGPSGVSLGATYNPNPLAAATLNTNNSVRNQALGNIYGEISFLKNFTLRNEISGNFDLGAYHQFFPTFSVGGLSSGPASAYESSTRSTSWTARNFLTYNKNISSLYTVTGLLGHEASSGSYESLTAGRSNFPSNTVTALNAGDGLTVSNSGGRGDWALESYFGRVNFGFNDRYLLTANVRFDGSGNFAPGNRWVATHSYALAWKIANEKFMKEQSYFSDLKLRLGYGIVANQNVGSYVYGASISLSSTGVGTGALVNNIANPKAEWEKTASYNAGLDVGLFSNRIQLTTDVYLRQTRNLLISLPLPVYGGTSFNGSLRAPIYNVGSIQNKGIEFSLNTRNIERKGVLWTSGLTLSRNLNKVLSLNTENAFLTQSVDYGSRVISRTSVGQSIGSFYGFVVEGMFNEASDFEGAALPAGGDGKPLPINYINGVWVGDLKYKDLNGDGIITEKDMTQLGSPIPKFQYGLTNTVTYKGFDLTLFVNGNYGNKIFNYNRVKQEDPAANFTGLLATTNDFARIRMYDPAGSISDINNVYVENAGTTVPGIRRAGDPNQNTRVSSRFVEDGSFLRMKNVVLGYTVPANFATRLHLSSLRVYTNVQNLFTITNYSGFDPEVGASILPGSPLLYGFDWGRYPTPRVFTAGLNIGL